MVKDNGETHGPTVTPKLMDLGHLASHQHLVGPAVALTPPTRGGIRGQGFRSRISKDSDAGEKYGEMDLIGYRNQLEMLIKLGII